MAEQLLLPGVDAVQEVTRQVDYHVVTWAENSRLVYIYSSAILDKPQMFLVGLFVCSLM